MQVQNDHDMKIIFVYNADSGLLNVVSDAVHKIVRPSTYPCRLCDVTYTLTGMRREWRQFIRSLDIPVEFLHRDQLSKAYGIDGVPLPAVFMERRGELMEWMSAVEINACRTLQELIERVRQRVDRSLGMRKSDA